MRHPVDENGFDARIGKNDLLMRFGGRVTGKGGFHIQYNVVDSRMLRDAQRVPDHYRDLVVRVAGFTQYWVEIGKQVQDELIARTEYEAL